MKKFIAIIFSFVAMTIVLVGCTSAKTVMRATVTEIDGTSLLVTPVEGSEELKSSDRFLISIADIFVSPEPLVGDTVEITYDGGIMETYPASFGGIRSIRVIK